MKTTKQLKQEERERIEQLTKEENKTIYSAISEADEQINTLKKAASTQNLDKTAKFYDSAIKSINKAKSSIEKTEKAKAKEEEMRSNLNKPKREKKEPYMERFVQVVEIEGKKKDKYEIQKTQTSPIITKYKAHKPAGLNKEQMEDVKQTIEELKERIKTLGDDYTFQQFKQYVNTCLKFEPDDLKESKIEDMAINW